jgi:alpha-L-rhamnosidase
VARWIDDARPNPASDAEFYADDPAPLFRKEFQVHGPVARARLYATGLGYYEASLNGARVGDHVLDPGWTAFEKRVSYSVYDVTRQLTRGANCLGLMLGKGWYDPLPLRMWGNLNLREHLATGRPRALAQLEIEYGDGTRQTLATDASWKLGEGSILRNSVYLGEVVDARREQAGWDRPGFDDSRWRAPALAAQPVGRLVAQCQPPIRITSTTAG